MPTLGNAQALVVGIADYANIRKLPKVQDAEDLAAALADPALCGYDPKNVAVLLDHDATKDKILSGLDDLQQRCDAESTAFLYFSGHGGVTPPFGNTGSPGSYVCNNGSAIGTDSCAAEGGIWYPDLRKTEFIFGGGVMVRF